MILCICTNAAAGGSVEMHEWIKTQGCPPFTEIIHSTVAINGRFQLLKWLIKYQNFPWKKTNICKAAARGGSVDMLEWLQFQGCPPFDENVCKIAAFKGHFQLLNQLREDQNYPVRDGCRMYYLACTK